MDAGNRPSAWVLHIDDFDDGVIRGWVLDRKRPDMSVSVEIASSGGETMTVLANGFRQDLLDANLGNGCHAFSIDIGSWDHAGNMVTVTASGAGETGPLMQISTDLAESLTRKPWSSRYLSLLNTLATPYAVANDAK